MTTRDRLPVRTARVSDATWTKAKARARREGTTMSQVVAVLVRGYATGALDLPQLVYTPARATDTPAHE